MLALVIHSLVCNSETDGNDATLVANQLYGCVIKYVHTIIFITVTVDCSFLWP